MKYVRCFRYKQVKTHRITEIVFVYKWGDELRSFDLDFVTNTDFETTHHGRRTKEIPIIK